MAIQLLNEGDFPISLRVFQLPPSMIQVVQEETLWGNVGPRKVEESTFNVGTIADVKYGCPGQ